VYPVSPSWTVRPDCLRDGFGSSFTRRGNDDDEKTQYLEAGKKRLAGDTAREATSNEVKQLPTESTALKETLAELLTGGRYTRYSASEKYEIIRLVEESSLPIRKTLGQLDIHKSTFYNWLNRYQEHGVDGLEDRKPSPTLTWNQIPDGHRDAIIDLALDKPALSPREIAVSYTDDRAYFVLGIHGLSPVKGTGLDHQPCLYPDASR
jgi:transposase-like protein